MSKRNRDGKDVYMGVGKICIWVSQRKRDSQRPKTDTKRSCRPFSMVMRRAPVLKDHGAVGQRRLEIPRRRRQHKHALGSTKALDGFLAWEAMPGAGAEKRTNVVRRHVVVRRVVVEHVAVEHVGVRHAVMRHLVMRHVAVRYVGER